MRNRPVSLKSVQEEGEIYGGGEDLWKRNVLSVEWKSDGVMDGESGRPRSRRRKPPWNVLSHKPPQNF